MQVMGSGHIRMCTVPRCTCSVGQEDTAGGIGGHGCTPLLASVQASALVAKVLELVASVQAWGLVAKALELVASVQVMGSVEQPK